MTKVYNISFLILAFCSISVFAQRTYETNPDSKRANVWYFGQNAGINFNTYPPTALTDGKVNTYEGCASLCDTAGNLLIYTDGQTVWNSNHDTLINGKGLLGDNSSTQAALIIIHPQKPNLAYIITTPHHSDFINIGARYNIIDIIKNEVIVKNAWLHGNSTEKITAVKHANGRDIWITGHEMGNDSFFSYLLTQNGIAPCVAYNKAGNDLIDFTGNGQGELKYSSDGKMLALTFYVDGLVQVFDFDNSNAQIKWQQNINTNRYVYGLEFSLNSQYLYVFERENLLFKFNLINKQKNTLRTMNESLRGGICKSPYGDILFNMADSTYLNNIFNSNNSSSIVQYNSIVLNKRTQYNLPNFNQSIFYNPAIDYSYSINCHNHEVAFHGSDTFGADSHIWESKKVYGINSYGLIGSTKDINYAFSDTGTYQVRYIASNINRADTIIKTIVLLDKMPLNPLGHDTVFCADKSILVNKTINENTCLLWHNGSQSNSQSFDSAGVYWVLRTNKAYCQMIDTFAITTTPLPNKPLLSHRNDTLYSTVIVADSFVWFKNGTRIYNNYPHLKINELGNYQLKIINNSCESISDIIQVNALDVKDSYLNIITVYPNPTQNSIQIEGLNLPNKVELISVNGKIFTLPIVVNRIDISSLSKGTYILKIIDTNNQTLIKQIIKQ
jgi:hypothetical protein